MLPYQIHAEQAQAKIGNWPRKGGIPFWLLDKIAEEKLSGGYSSDRNPVCPECHVRKANNGSCSCDL
jgi:hypothetical protein